MQRSGSGRVVVVASALVLAVLGWALLGDIGTSLLVGVNDDAGYYLRIARNDSSAIPEPSTGSTPRTASTHCSSGCTPRLSRSWTPATAKRAIGSGSGSPTCSRCCRWGSSCGSAGGCWRGSSCWSSRTGSCRGSAASSWRGFSSKSTTAWTPSRRSASSSPWWRCTSRTGGAIRGCGSRSSASWRSLAALARLDCLSFAVAFGVYYGLQAAVGRLPARHVLAFAAPVVLGVGAYMLANHREFGILLPVSAQLKNSFPHPDVATRSAPSPSRAAGCRTPSSSTHPPPPGWSGASPACAACFRPAPWAGRQPVARPPAAAVGLCLRAHAVLLALQPIRLPGHVHPVPQRVRAPGRGPCVPGLGAASGGSTRRRASAAAGNLLLAAALGILGIRAARLAQLATQERLDELDLGVRSSSSRLPTTCSSASTTGSSPSSSTGRSSAGMGS